jgi:hypothetical protein
LAGIQLTDDLGIPDRFVFPSGSQVAGFGQVLVRCQTPSRIDESDGQIAAPPTPYHAFFGLNRNGGSLFLLGSKSLNTPILDQIHYGILPADVTLARVPDATGPWVLSHPTPLFPNQPAELSTATSLRINEWMANPASGNDWFELYNPDPLPVDLSRWTLSDDPANPAKHPIAPLSFIAGKSHLQFHADDQPDQGPHHVRFQLSARGEFIGLYSPEGIEIDSVTFGSQLEGISQGRLPDGSVTVTRFTPEGTPGLPNWADSDADGQSDPWELDHGFSSENPDDALLDADSDGMNNRDEFRAGTDPREASDLLQLRLIKSHGDRLELEFRALAGHAYRIQVRDALEAPWRDLENVPPRGLPRRIRMRITPTDPFQYLRLVLLAP